MQILSTFAGCEQKTSAMTATEEFIYFICTSNVIRVDINRCSEVFPFSCNVNCIASGKDLLLVGCVDGSFYTIANGCVKRHEQLEDSIQACAVFEDGSLVLATLNEIAVKNIESGDVIKQTYDGLTCCIETMGSNTIFIGTLAGKIHIYEVEENTIKPVEIAEAHPERVNTIKRLSNRRLASGSQDSNIKIWKYDGALQHCQALNGHIDRVNRLEWDGTLLYSASSDKTIKTWIEENDLNTNESSKSALGFTNQGIIGGGSEFLGVCSWNDKIFAQSKTGGIDMYVQSNYKGCYECQYFTSGHSLSVTDLDWRDGMLLSCSLDFTARIFYKGVEVGRPQVHGHPISSAKFLKGDRLRIVSAAQETILRIFEATQTFYQRCGEADKIGCSSYGETNILDFKWAKLSDEYACDAMLSELNLTNEILHNISTLPLSECALSGSVFKEYLKIYGHFFDLKSVAVSDGLIFSCNRSQSKDFAGLFVWNEDGKKLDYRTDHTLGIQKIDAAKDHVLTVSRDRTACLYRTEGTKLVRLGMLEDHSRVIWDCGISPSLKYFATCSRDYKIIIYDLNTLKALKTREFHCEVTAVDFNPVVDEKLAVGLIDGSLYILNSNLEDLERYSLLGKAVNVVKYDESGQKLAVGGSDGVVRIISL